MTFKSARQRKAVMAKLKMKGGWVYLPDLLLHTKKNSAEKIRAGTIKWAGKPRKIDTAQKDIKFFFRQRKLMTEKLDHEKLDRAKQLSPDKAEIYRDRAQGIIDSSNQKNISSQEKRMSNLNKVMGKWINKKLK